MKHKNQIQISLISFLLGWLGWIILICLIAFLNSCNKQEIIKPPVYEMITIWYNKDTSNQRLHERIIINEDRPQYTVSLDTTKDAWAFICELNVLQQIYYAKNGKKIQSSKWPKP